MTGVVVVDLSSLWAGPLCTQLLAAAGATVLKVETVQRPDGARHGTATFFDLLHAGKRSVLVDLHDDGSRAALRALLQRADVVVEASRPRALAHLGLSVAHVAPAGGPRVWCRLTGHGGDAVHRVGFGDDAAVAGGLVAWEDGEPRFVADAAADPATGLTAAVAIVDRLAAGGRWTVDVALSRTAAALAHGPVTAPVGPAAPPRARPVTGGARPLGADTGDVLRRYAS
jgi:crotonobetainyl-CoA:carnitine CoA-transferase CaiB-like acyl-CoA transferase